MAPEIGFEKSFHKLGNLKNIIGILKTFIIRSVLRNEAFQLSFSIGVTYKIIKRLTRLLNKNVPN